MKDTRLSIDDLPALPRDQDGPVFNQPWEAKAFALAVRLSEAGCFTWPEWVKIFSQEIKAAQERGDPDLGDTYYQHWLNALERICAAKGLVGSVRRECPCDQPASAGPYPRAPLRSRSRGRNSRIPRRLCLPGPKRRRIKRRSASLQRALYGRGIVGPERLRP